MSSPSALPHRSVTAQLDAEWHRLCRRPATLRRATGWRIVDTPIGSLDEVLTAVGYQTPPSPAADARLADLVAHARHDDLAARVVVRRLTPLALSVAGRRRAAGCHHAVDELFGALWIAIRTYDQNRRPACLPAALVADADYRAFRAGWRHADRAELPTDRIAELPAADAAPDPAAELAGLIEDARVAGVATDDDLALVRGLLAEPSPTRLAIRLNLNERTIRNRRDRLALRLRDLARQLDAA